MRWVFTLCTIAYLAALGFYFGSAVGWFGHASDELAGDVMRWLGLPWHFFAGGQEPWIVLVAELLAPAVNLGIVWLLADLLDSREE